MKNVPIPDDATNIKLNSEKRSLGSETYFDDFRQKEGNNTDISEIFHENTKIKQINNKFVRSIRHFMRGHEQVGGGFAPCAEKIDLPLVELPEPNRPNVPLGDAIAQRNSVRQYDDDPISVEELSTLLRYGCGAVGGELEGYEDVEFESRGYPSAGGLYPVEPYAIVMNASGLDTGVYYYSAREHGLRVLEKIPRESLLERVEALASTWQMEYDSASVLFALTSMFWKNKIKYGPRGYRFGLLEAGHVMQNVQIVAAALDLGTCSIGGLDENKLDPFLDVNGVDESTVYGCFVGAPVSGGDGDEQ